MRPESRPILSCSRNSAHPQFLKQIANALNVKLREPLQVTAQFGALVPNRPMSAFGGKADIDIGGQMSANDPKRT
jgi:hypothetical protein